MPKRTDIVIGIVLAAGVLLAFKGALAAMVAQWNISPMYSYGYTVPPISAYLIWSRREQLRRPVVPARLGGVIVIGASLAMLIVGQLAALQVLQQLAFIVAIAGVVLYLFGLRHLAICGPAIAYLLFMVPVWDAFTEPLHYPFQNNSARLGVALMQSIGVPVYRDNTFITLPNLLIEVARECSGINYLVAVLALALPLALLRLQQTWRRVVMIVSALVIAALANGLRVALIGTLAYYEVGSPLHGPFHVLHGLFVAGIGYVVLFVGLRLLQEKPVAPAVPAAPAASPLPAPLQWRRGEALAVAGVFWLMVFVGLAPETQAVSFAGAPQSPASLGSWLRMPARPPLDRSTDPAFAAWGSADHTVREQYRSAAGRIVTLDVHLFAAQRQGSELINFNSSELHRLSSLTPVQRADGTVFNTNVWRRADRAELGMFWYDLDGTSETGLYRTKLRTMWSALRSGGGHAAAVVLRTPVQGNEAEAAAALREFARELQPALVRFWPADSGAAAAQR